MGNVGLRQLLPCPSIFRYRRDHECHLPSPTRSGLWPTGWCRRLLPFSRQQSVVDDVRPLVGMSALGLAPAHSFPRHAELLHDPPRTPVSEVGAGGYLSQPSLVKCPVHDSLQCLQRNAASPVRPTQAVVQVARPELGSTLRPAAPATAPSRTIAQVGSCSTRSGSGNLNRGISGIAA